LNRRLHRFGLVHEELDYRNAGNRTEFTWAGRVEMDEASGSGLAAI